MILTSRLNSSVIGAFLILMLGGCARPSLRMKHLEHLTHETAHTVIKNTTKKTTLRFREFSDAEWSTLCPRSKQPIADLEGLIIPVQVSLENEGTSLATFDIAQQPYSAYQRNHVIKLLDGTWSIEKVACFGAGISAVFVSLYSAVAFSGGGGMIRIGPVYGALIGLAFSIPIVIFSPIGWVPTGIAIGVTLFRDNAHIQEYTSSVGENIVTSSLIAQPHESASGLIFIMRESIDQLHNSVIS